MKHILAHIEERQAAYEQHPFILFLRDENHTPHERLAYAPFVCHFVQTFAEFNRYFLHSGKDAKDRQGSGVKVKEPRLQDAVDIHAEEDSRHFSWFLQDLKVLGYDIELSFTDALRFLWSDHGFRTRDLGYYAISAVRDADPEVRLAVIEAVEAMGNVWLSSTLQAARKHPDADRLVYFGQHHLDRETGHAIGSDHSQTSQVELSQEQREKALVLVDGLYERMMAFNTEILERVRSGYARDGANRQAAVQQFLQL